LSGHSYLHEAMGDPFIREKVIGALGETSEVIVKEHGFDPKDQQAYSTRAIRRFENPGMRDLILRLAKDPIRKLGPEDRLVRPARLAFKHGITPKNIALGIAAGLLYDFPEDAQARELSKMLEGFGLGGVLSKVCGLSASEGLWPLVVSTLEELMGRYGVKRSFSFPPLYPN